MPETFVHRYVSRWNQTLKVLMVAAWLGVVVSAHFLLLQYKSTAGQTGQSPKYWPTSAAIDCHDSKVVLLMFAHPRCPCTRASLGELAQIVASGQFGDVRVIFYRPESATSDWLDSDIVRQAKAMTGVRVDWDDGGQLAAQFGARTSGHVLLYVAGELKFSGGITAYRGHEGWNAGRAAVVALGCGRSETSTSVFGCPLATPATSIESTARTSE